MAFGDFKDLTRKIVSDKILHDKPFNIAKNSKHDGYQSDFASVVYNFIDKKSASGAATIAKNLQSNLRKVYSPFSRHAIDK